MELVILFDDYLEVNDLKIAFWDSYILNNLTQDNMEHMYKLYSEFLNGAILNKYHDKGIYNRTIHHVALGYLHSLKHCKKMLITFIENPSNKNSIDVMCKSILEIVKSKNNKYKFENKLFDLWNRLPNFTLNILILVRSYDLTHSDNRYNLVKVAANGDGGKMLARQPGRFYLVIH